MKRSTADWPHETGGLIQDQLQVWSQPFQWKQEISQMNGLE